ncbi:MAG: hypothetical protein ABIP51_15710, partial [Bacteroidia bacterium]
ATDYGIWNNISTWVTSSIVGTFKSNEAITANNGATGTLFTAITGNKFISLTGNFAAATSITGNVSGATANIASVVVKSYTVGTNVIWGGKHWTNVNGNVGASTSILVLNTEWTALAYDATNYNMVIDPIQYDYVNDLIIKREDNNGNTVINTKAEVTTWISPRVISMFQWGNPYVESTNKGCGDNKIINSYVDTVNNIGSFAYNELYDRSYVNLNTTYIGNFKKNVLRDGANITSNSLLSSEISENYMSNGSTVTPAVYCVISSNVIYNGAIKANIITSKSNINSNFLNGGYIYLNSLKNISTISSNTLVVSNIYQNELINSCNINSNTFTNSSIYANTLSELCTINSNVITVATNFDWIRSNIIRSNSHIDSNTATNYCLIQRNLLDSYSYIQGNTMSSTANTNTTAMYSNILKSSGILNNTISMTGTNTILGIMHNTLTGADSNSGWKLLKGILSSNSITNCSIGYNEVNNGTLQNITTSGIDVYQNKMSNLTLDYTGVTISKSIFSFEASTIKLVYNTSITFNNTAGAGSIGTVTIPAFLVPIGYFIEKLIVGVDTTLVGSGAIINLGLATDNTTAGLNNTTGALSTLNTNVITVLQTPSITKSTVLQLITMSVTTAAITAGVLSLTIELKKI